MARSHVISSAAILFCLRALYGPSEANAAFRAKLRSLSFISKCSRNKRKTKEMLKFKRKNAFGLLPNWLNLQIWIQKSYLRSFFNITCIFFFASILYSHHDNNNANMQKAAAKLNYNIAGILASWWCHVTNIFTQPLYPLPWGLAHLAVIPSALLTR